MKISTLATLFLLLFTSCVQHREPVTGKPVISVSILPQKYFIKQLAGDRVEVNVLVPPGANPATYEPSVSQLSHLDRSAIYMKIGYLGFELGWMDKICSVNPSMEVINLSDGVDLIKSKAHDFHHGRSFNRLRADPHIWMSARNAKPMATQMAEALCRLLPDDSIQIADNLIHLMNRLDSLDQKIRTILKGAEGRGFLIYHPSLSYFARDYKLKQFSMEWEGKTPSPAHMKSITDLGREHHISTIFIQVEFDRKNAEVLSKEIGAKTVQINPLDFDWPGQMIHIAMKLKEQW